MYVFAKRETVSEIGRGREGERGMCESEGESEGDSEGESEGER